MVCSCMCFSYFFILCCLIHLPLFKFCVWNTGVILLDVPVLSLDAFQRKHFTYKCDSRFYLGVDRSDFLVPFLASPSSYIQIHVFLLPNSIQPAGSHQAFA